MTGNKNVVVYLSRSNEREMGQLLESLRLLEANILPWSPADVIVFHEADFDKSRLMGDPVVVRLGVKFALVDFSSVPPGTEGLSPGQRGYRHMCHFFANEIFLREELRDYDYYMRLDVDSYVLSKVGFNIFEKMARENLKYVYRMEMTESKSVSAGLLDAALAFFAAHPVLDRAKPRINKVRLYYTNFEICELAYFRGEPWQRFFSAIDAAGGIWSHRWGDAPIRWLGLQHLLCSNERWCFKGMTYFHQFLVRKGFTFRLPLEYMRGVMVAIFGIIRSKLQ